MIGVGWRGCPLLIRCAAAQDEAAGQQREAAEQDGDRREAGEGQLARLGRGRGLALGLGLGLLGRQDAAFLGLVLGARLLGRRRLGLLGRQDAALLADVTVGAALARLAGVGRRDRAARRGRALGVLLERGVAA